MNKKLYRSMKDRVFAGVCGGFAEFFGIDPSMVRLGWVVFCLLGGSGFIAYIAAAIIIPADTSWQSRGPNNDGGEEQNPTDQGGWR